MVSRLLRNLFPLKEPPVERVETVGHGVLGELRFDREREAWVASVETSAARIEFEIGGTKGPDERLLSHAVDIVQTPEEFLASVKRFLDVEAGQHPRASQKIQQLTLETVCLWWPDRPDDGMLYFASPDDPLQDHGVWRCDYVGRTPRGLGCDT